MLTRRRGEGGDGPAASVIVPTKNSSKTLARCLSSFTTTDQSTYEILVVDGGSTDRTREVAESFEVRFVDENLPRSSARFRGAELAKGSYLLFIDADQWAEPGLVDDCIVAIEELGSDCVAIPEKDDGITLWARCRRLERALSEASGLVYPRFFRKSAYVTIGGHSWDLQDYMEDRDLYLRARRAGLRFASATRALHNDVNRTNPVELGIKNGMAARDAILFYRRNPTLGESPWTVVRPRVVQFLTTLKQEDPGIGTLMTMPLYLCSVYGPRGLAASYGWLRARLGDSLAS
jgi:glycosyltransferase involved in cell wall biosynthesis